MYIIFEGRGSSKIGQNRTWGVGSLSKITSDSKKRLHIRYCIQKQMCNHFFESDVRCTFDSLHAEIARTVYCAGLPKLPLNQYKPVTESRNQALRAYCLIYTLRPSNRDANGFRKLQK